MNYPPQTLLEEPHLYGESKEGFKNAFLRGIEEYNNYGTAATNSKYRIDATTGLQLWGFKVSWPNL